MSGGGGMCEAKPASSCCWSGELSEDRGAPGASPCVDNRPLFSSFGDPGSTGPSGCHFFQECCSPEGPERTSPSQSWPKQLHGATEGLEPMEVHGPVAAGTLVAEPAAERLGKVEEAARSPHQGFPEGGGQRPACTAGEGVGWNGSCDQVPTGLLEEEGLHFTESSVPGSCLSSYERSCSCRGESLDLSRTYLEKGNCSCSITCQRWASESPGAEDEAFAPDSAPSLQGQEQDEEDDGVSKASEDPSDSGRALGGRKNGRRQRHRSGTKDKEEGKENAKREGRSAPAGGKHRQARKRSHADRRRHLKAEVPRQLEELAWVCVSCFKKLIKLVLVITHECGEYVEAGGRLLYSCCQLDAWDLASAQGSMRTWSQRARSSSGKAARWLGSGGNRLWGLLKMLGALLFLVLMLLLGSLRLCWRVSKSLLLAGAAKLGRTSSVARLRSLLDAPLLRRTWALVTETRTCKYVAHVLQKWRGLLGAAKGLRTDGLGEAVAGPDPGPGGRYQPSQEVARLLALADVPEEELNPFQVLGLEVTASDTELKKAYRQLAVLVHPDKNKHPRAEEAFKVLRAAWDIVSNPEKRKEYEIKRMAESELTKSMNEFLTKLREDLKEAMNTMMCSKCQGKHKRFEMDRDPLSARYCAECGKLHPAEEGDFWAESSMLGLKITYFALMDGKVYDITEWAGCQRVGISPDTHRVPYHISFGARSSGSGGRQRTASEGSPTSAADLQDFFNRVFQGTPGQMPNGGFFSPPQPPRAAAPSAPAPKTESAAPKGDSKQKRRKKVRRPFQR
ncbi:dnaJ homolog subfamily C member 14 [Malaclemys terrapin pileata]|uniref:dnaJ homolog subfamily C member 14 n=1 Tax=Malaclemys terrapin pileata TaxID=2991368 RepID=UPI0023A7FB3A|nr:dnaJ homolog subfamily C member 14 [Malaclemys terrapin pileata]